jgi:hypothetical protein
LSTAQRRRVSKSTGSEVIEWLVQGKSLRRRNFCAASASKCSREHSLHGQEAAKSARLKMLRPARKSGSVKPHRSASSGPSDGKGPVNTSVVAQVKQNVNVPTSAW